MDPQNKIREGNGTANNPQELNNIELAATPISIAKFGILTDAAKSNATVLDGISLTNTRYQPSDGRSKCNTYAYDVFIRMRERRTTVLTAG